MVLGPAALECDFGNRTREEVQHQSDGGRNGDDRGSPPQKRDEDSPGHEPPGAGQAEPPRRLRDPEGLRPEEGHESSEKLSSDQVRSRIVEGQRRRAYMKKGLTRRILDNLKWVAYGVLPMSLAALGTGLQGTGLQSIPINTLT